MAVEIQAKRFLQECTNAARHIDTLREERFRVMAMATRCTPSYTGMPHASGTSDKVYDGVARLDEVERMLEKETSFYEKMCLLAHEIIREIKDVRYRDILMLRYMSGKSWEHVAEKMGYESNYIWRVHGHALLAAQEIMDRKMLESEEAKMLIVEACGESKGRKHHT